MLFILNRSFDVINNISINGDISKITPYYNDSFARDLATGAETFSFDIEANIPQAIDVTVGNYIAFKDEDEEFKLFTITDTEENHNIENIKKVYCEMASIELLNNQLRPIKYNNITVSSFLESILSNTDWSLGIKDISLREVKDIDITDYISVYEAIQNYVIGEFGAEIRYRVKIESNTIVGKYIDIFSKRGKNSDIVFSYTTNMTNVSRTTNISDLVTALIGVGKNNITFRDIEVEGKPAGQDFIASEEAYKRWSKNGEHIIGVEKFDTESPQELLKLTAKKLVERIEPKIKYSLKVELLGDKVSIGDTVRVVDHDFNPPLYLEARVSQLKTHKSDPTKDEVVLSNFKEIGSNITEGIKNIASKLEDYIDSQFPIGGDKIQDGSITEDKLHNGEIIQETHIYADSIDTKHLKADVITSDKIQANSIETKHLKAEIINAGHINSDSITSKHIQANTIDTHHLKANTIQSGHIQSNSIDTNHLKANIINASHIQAGSITSGSGIIGDGAIGNAQISSLDATKIKSGTIDTSKVTVQGANGHLRLKGNRMQVFDGIGNQAKERVSVGDVNGDGTVYGLRVRGKDGNTIILDENGVTNAGITDGSITNDKISDDANIEGYKLNINSVINSINEDGTEVIQGTKIEVDGTNLGVTLSEIQIQQDENTENISQAQSQITANTNAIGLKVDEQVYTADKANMTSKLEKNTSEISAIKGQIALKVEQVDIENAKNEMGEIIDSKIESAKSEIKITTDSISQSVGKIETNITTIDNKAESALTTATNAGNKADQAQSTANNANVTANQAKSEIQQTNTKLASLETNLDGITSSVSDIQDKTTILDGKVNAQETRLATAEQKITPSAITNVVQSANFVKDMNGKINTNTSNISKVEQTANSITNRVEALDGKYTEIKQTVDGIDVTGKVSFSDLSTVGKTTIHGGNIKSDTLAINSLSSNNDNPIIKLFPTTDASGNKSYCSIDATQKFEQGIGNAIRLKWDSMNYILQKRSGVDFYMEPRESGNAFGFKSDRGEYYNGNESRIITREGTLAFRGSDGLAFYTSSSNAGRKLLTTYDVTSSVTSSDSSAVASAYGVKQAYDKAVSAYNLANGKANSSHSHSGETWGTLNLGNLYTNYLNYKDGSVTNWGIISSAHLAPSATNIWLGSYNHARWGGCMLTQAPNVSSDARLKENIKYIDGKARSKDSLSHSKFYDFIKNDFKLAEYDYIIDEASLASNDEEYVESIRMLNNHKIGFIAQDIVNTEVGSRIITQNTADGLYGYDTGNLTAVIAGALKEEIKRREELEDRCTDLEERLVKLEKILESKL